MRKSLWIILTALLVAIGTPSAHADSYTADFTCTTCEFLPSAPDVSFPSPTTVQETWDGITLDIPLLTGDSPTDSYTWTDSFEVSTAFVGGEVSFVIDDLTTGDVESITESYFGTPLIDTGDLSFAAVATPEPSSVVLMLLGIGMLFVMRKRIGRGLPQAS